AGGVTGLDIQSLTLTNGSATNGGALYLYSGSEAILSAVTLSDSTATNNGGGLFLNGSTVALSDCIIADNTASSYGGGMSLTSSTATLTDCTIADNTADTTRGGGLFLNNSIVDATTCDFSDNDTEDLRHHNESESYDWGLNISFSCDSSSCTSTADNDGDGYSFDDGDCDESNSEINPDAEEIPIDGVDNDCDGDAETTLDLSSADAVLTGENSDDRAGSSVSSAGDVNGDGFDDILVGAYASDGGGTTSGAAYLVLGPVTADLDLSSADAAFTGEDTYDSAGSSLSSAGDMDGDGFDDILIGAFNNDSGGGSYSGSAYLLFGPVTADLDLSSADVTLIGDAGERAGYAVSSAGDVDGDGFDDILVGAYSSDSGATDSGAAYLLSGPVTADLNLSSADAMLTGADADDSASWSVSSAGDVDGDGFDDILVGAPYNDDGGSNSGAAYLVLGPVTADLDLSSADATLTGEDAGDSAGWSVSSAGDVDGDGFDDVLIGAPYNAGGGFWSGAAYLVSGPITADLSLSSADAKFTGEDYFDWAGDSVSDAGDFDGDGFDDLLIGAYASDGGGTTSGAAYLVLGPVTADLDLSSADARLIGDAGDYAGTSVSGAGDMDGDGFDDLLVGASSAGDNGVAYLVLSPY
ncbi:MAG: parallel beta-helix repeat protein, partial [Myxococcota bacterium]